MCEGDFTPIPADRNEDRDVMFVEVVAAPSAPMLPDGQIGELHVQPPSQKYSGVLFNPNHFYIHLIPPSQEGRFAIVTDVEAGCGGRRRRVDEGAVAGRRSRVVLTPRRWRQVSGGTKPATVARKPGHRGEREISC